MKIGILGGSFDPIHNGHLNMAEKAYQEYDLDYVLLMPAGHSPNKSEDKMTNAFHRLKMTQLATELNNHLKASSLEIDSNERSYTYRTMEKLHSQYPNDQLYFIMGADSLDYFEQWVHPEIICQHATILVVNRDQFTENELSSKIRQIQCLFPADIRIVHCDKYDISSHELRRMILEGVPVDEFLPYKVINYIKEHHLYRGI